MFTQTEKKKIEYFEEKLQHCNSIIEEHNKMVQIIKEEIKEIEDKLNLIIVKSRIREIKKCKHEIQENPTIYYDSCGHNWCELCDYHKHFHCWKCGYVKDEPS